MKTTRPTAQKTSGAFRMDCAVRATIQASPAKIWSLLTDAAAFPRWNSTVTSIEGTIAEGETLKLRVPNAPTRVFTPKVSAVTPGRSMVWSDGMAPMFRGVRPSAKLGSAGWDYFSDVMSMTNRYFTSPFSMRS